MTATHRSVRVLLLGDTHLGFDQPRRPRIRRRRRGPDFLRNFELALARVQQGDIDLVVHGGDLLYRSKVPPALVHEALAPLIRVARAGTPVFLVPGNHERSAIPYRLLAQQHNLHIFDGPRTFFVDVRGARVGISGFPSEREVRSSFTQRLEETRWREQPADVRLLCVHQAVEGATVGQHDFVFRRNKDVIRGADLPAGFAALLSGHIHRHQVLEHDLRGAPLPAPVIYPGSVERTAFAEMGEPKGYIVMDLVPDGAGGRVDLWDFVLLPARPMVSRELNVACRGAEKLAAELRALFAGLDPDAVLRLRVEGEPEPVAAAVLRAASLRALAPETMNVELSFSGATRPFPRPPRASGSASRSW